MIKIPAAFRAITACVIALLTLLPAAPWAGPTYYFSSKGDDRNDGLTPATARRSLGAIPSLLDEGVTILLQRGDAWEVSGLLWTIANRSGSAAEPIRIGAYGEAGLAAPRIKSTDATQPLIRIRDSRHVVIEDLEWRGPATWRAVRLEGRNTGIDLNRVAMRPTRPVVMLGAGTYYVSNEGDDDNNDGLTAETPFQNANNVDTWIGPGVTILLKRGDKWKDPTMYWDLSNKGATAQQPMRIGAYGPGQQKPVVAKLVVNEPGDWTEVGAGSGHFTTPQRNGVTTDNTYRLYINESPLPKIDPQLALTTNTYKVTSDGKIHVQLAAGSAAPTTESIQKNGAEEFIKAFTPDHLTIDDIAFRGGDIDAVMLFDAPSQSLTLRNLDLRQFRSYGMKFNRQLATAAHAHVGLTVENCFIDKGWTTAMNTEWLHSVNDAFNRVVEDGSPGGDGISLKNAVDGGVIRGCTILNMGHSGIHVGYDDATETKFGIEDLIIEGNVVTTDVSSYCRAISLGGPAKVRNNIVRRNYFYDCNIGSQIGGDATYTYSNIWDTTNLATGHSNWAMAHVSLGLYVGEWSPNGPKMTMTNCVFANNTLINAGSHFNMMGVSTAGNLASGNIISNNIVQDWRPTEECQIPCGELTAAFRNEQPFAGAFTFDNNGFWDPEGDPNVYLVEVTPSTPVSYDINGFHTLNIGSDNQYANPQFVGGSGANPAKYLLSSSSPYVAGGKPLSQVLPAGVAAVDFYGSPFAPDPSRGAIQYGALASIAIVEPLIDTLEVGQPIALTSGKSPSNAEVSSYLWEVRISGNLVATYTTPNISYTPTAPTNFTFTVRGTDPFGTARTSAPKTAVVRELPRIDLYTAGGPLSSGSTVNVNVLAQVFNATTALTVTRNGGAYSMPGDGWFTADGVYVISAEGVTFVQKNFTIDKTPPQVFGVENGATYPGDRNVTFSDGTATLNGAPFTGGLVTSEQTHVIVVTDAAGNVTNVTFTIDRTAPTVSVADGTITKQNLQITFSDGTATLNGAPFTSGTIVSNEGSYTLIATDAVGNSRTVNFTIDKTAPSLQAEYRKNPNTWEAVSGTVNGKPIRFYYTESNVTPLLTLDGNVISWTSAGQEFITNGTYIARLTDQAGNWTEVTAVRGGN